MNGWVALDRDVVRVGGPEAVTWLQGQLSQDVAGLAVGASAWSFALQPQGKVDAWMRVTRTADDALVLDLDGGWGPRLVERLQRFKLRVKADVDLLDWGCIAVRGADAIPAGAIPFRWADFAGYDIIGPAAAPPAGLPAATAEDYELRRIEVGLPRMGAELTDRTIPEESGVVGVSVSFTKGCYTGQELVARIDSRGGHVPRHLRGVRTIRPITRGTAVEVGAKEVGTVTSAAAHPDGHGVALAYVARDVEPPAECTAGGIEGRIVTLPQP